MRVELRLFATFARYLPETSQTDSVLLDVDEGSTVADVAAALGIPANLARVILVNDADGDESRPLHSGDVVTLFPPLAGGSAGRVIHSSG